VTLKIIKIILPLVKHVSNILLLENRRLILVVNVKMIIHCTMVCVIRRMRNFLKKLLVLNYHKNLEVLMY
jgi:hypothetical protein